MKNTIVFLNVHRRMLKRDGVLRIGTERKSGDKCQLLYRYQARAANFNIVLLKKFNTLTFHSNYFEFNTYILLNWMKQQITIKRQLLNDCN